MSLPREELKWLPDELEAVALRLARADECAFKIGDLISQWSLDEPMDLEQVRCGDTVQLVVKAVRPVPPEASLLFSEAVNHLRAAIDNVVWHLVEQEHGDVSGAAASLVNMPIHETQEGLDKWTHRRAKITAFGSETELGRRLRALQPFVDVESSVSSMGGFLAALTRQEIESAHPLRLLQGYSNADKHRSIRLAAARSFSSTDATPLSEQDLAHQEIKVGDAMGPRTPWGQVSFLDTNPAVMVQRPEPYSAWVNPVKDLNGMRRHVSQVVVPILLTGLEMPGGLPPVIEMGDNGLSTGERLAAGEWDDAESRLVGILQGRYQEALKREPRFAPVRDCAEEHPHAH